MANISTLSNVGSSAPKTPTQADRLRSVSAAIADAIDRIDQVLSRAGEPGTERERNADKPSELKQQQPMCGTVADLENQASRLCEQVERLERIA